MSELSLTVAICTYNRSSLLSDVLSDLLDQNPDFSQIEILVVDNNSSDDTQSVVEKKFIPKNVRYVFEKNQGLSHARNRAYREARGKYIAYLDDDARIPKTWIETALDIIETIKPDVFGGPYVAFYTSEKPKWFKDVYGSRILSPKAYFLKQNEFLSGGNMAFKRSILESVRGFSVDFGMKGDKISYGEETALMLNLRVQHPTLTLYYSPDLKIEHLVRSVKFDLFTCMRMQFNVGFDTYMVFKNQLPPLPIKLEWYYKFFRQSIIVFFKFFTCPFRDRKRFPFYQNYLYEIIFKEIKTLGSLRAMYKVMHAKNIYV